MNFQRKIWKPRQPTCGSVWIPADSSLKGNAGVAGKSKSVRRNVWCWLNGAVRIEKSQPRRVAMWAAASNVAQQVCIVLLGMEATICSGYQTCSHRIQYLSWGFWYYFGQVTSFYAAIPSFWNGDTYSVTLCIRTLFSLYRTHSEYFSMVSEMTFNLNFWSMLG